MRPGNLDRHCAAKIIPCHISESVGDFASPTDYECNTDDSNLDDVLIGDDKTLQQYGEYSAMRTRSDPKFEHHHQSSQVVRLVPSYHKGSSDIEPPICLNRVLLSAWG